MYNLILAENTLSSHIGFIECVGQDDVLAQSRCGYNNVQSAFSVRNSLVGKNTLENFILHFWMMKLNSEMMKCISEMKFIFCNDNDEVYEAYFCYFWNMKFISVMMKFISVMMKFM